MKEARESSFAMLTNEEEGCKQAPCVSRLWDDWAHDGAQSRDQLAQCYFHPHFGERLPGLSAPPAYYSTPPAQIWLLKERFTISPPLLDDFKVN